MAKKAISARIDENTLVYIKGCHQPLNSLINELLKKWMKERQDKELLIWKEDTEQNEFSKMKQKNDIKCRQSCSNCIYSYKTWCKKNEINLGIAKRPKMTFCCIYWEKKKGSR